MKAIIYCSDNLGLSDEFEITQMLEQAQAQNSLNGITGYIYYHNNQFLQYFEGETHVVESLWYAIQQDKRHKIKAKAMTHISSRLFPSWHMRDFNALTEVEKMLFQHLTVQMKLLVHRKSLFMKFFFKGDNIWHIVEKIKATFVFHDQGLSSD